MVEHPKNPPDQSRQVLSRAKRTLRWWQFSLRTLLLFTTACAGAAWWISYPLERARQQRIAVEKLQVLGARVTYEYELRTPPEEPPGPAWLRGLLGVDLFSDVVHVEAICWDPNRQPQASVPLTYLRSEDLNLLKQLPHLKYVRIVGNGCTDSSLSFLNSLDDLRSLDVDGDFTDEGMRRISQSQQITSLTLGGWARFTEDGFARLADLRALESLDISWSEAKGSWLTHLARLRHLRSVRHGYPIRKWTDEDSGGVATLIHLTHLDICGNEITDAGVAKLGALVELESLSLNDARIDRRFAGCRALSSNLRRILLDNTALDDCGLQTLARFRHLQALSLSGTKVTDAGLANLSNETELEELYLSSTGIDGTGLKHLNRLAHLNRLELQGTQLGDAATAAIALYPQLSLLDLDSTQITDAGLANLASLSELTEVHLQDTAITDAGLKSLSGLRHMRSLNLYSTLVTDAGLMHLRSLADLEELNLANTVVTAQGAAKLKQFCPKAVIDRGGGPVGAGFGASAFH